jgi:hypothetical protein
MSEDRAPHHENAPLAEPASRRVLLFELGGRGYAIPVSAVAGLADGEPTRRVPGAPPHVLGLAEWRGDVLTVLDLSRLLGHPAGDGAGCLVRLAPPLQRAALFVRASLRLAEIARASCLPEADAAPPGRDVFDGSFEHGGIRVRSIDPLLLIRSVDTPVPERG